MFYKLINLRPRAFTLSASLCHWYPIVYAESKANSVLHTDSRWRGGRRRKMFAKEVVPLACYNFQSEMTRAKKRCPRGTGFLSKHFVLSLHYDSTSRGREHNKVAHCSPNGWMVHSEITLISLVSVEINPSCGGWKSRRLLAAWWMRNFGIAPIPPWLLYTKHFIFISGVLNFLEPTLSYTIFWTYSSLAHLVPPPGTSRYTYYIIHSCTKFDTDSVSTILTTRFSDGRLFSWKSHRSDRWIDWNRICIGLANKVIQFFCAEKCV